jgi:uncharacterized repeat protein (TIGR03803 family)
MARTVRAQSPAAEKIVFNFRPATGNFPTGVIRDAAGNLYVPTDMGGSSGRCHLGCGNILKVSPSGQPTVLYAFTPTSSKIGPGPSGLVRDAKGILYGATGGGGHHGRGSVYKLAPSGAEKTIHNFDPAAGDGDTPGPVTMDSAGNLYGTSYSGGGTGCGGSGCGIVYSLTSSGSETVLYSFTGGTDGQFPEGTVILDASGNIYGTTTQGGDLDCPLFPGDGCGTVWKLDTSRNLTVLYSFTGGTDGAIPGAGLAMDPSENLYGVAGYGGDFSCNPGFGCGVAFEFDTTGNLSVLHAFAGGPDDGQAPNSTLLRDSAGNLYGTTAAGGDLSCILVDNPGCGVVFKLDTSDNETILHAFTGGTTDGEGPESTLVSDGKGNLYGVTPLGGIANGGVIFAVKQ